MSEEKREIFTHQELTALLLKERKIHKGFWAIVLEFQLGATMAGPSKEEQYPTGLVSIRRIGIQPAKKTDPLAIDAAVVNPKTPLSKKAPAKRID